MRLKLGLEQVGETFYKDLVKELGNYADCTVKRDGEEVIVEMEGDIVKCSCIVAVCDKYRFSSGIKVPENKEGKDND